MTRNGERNANRNPEWLGDFSQLQIQIKQKSQFEFVPWDTSEFKSNQNLNSTLYRDIPRNLIFSILTSWLKSPHHSRFRFAFLSEWHHFEFHPPGNGLYWRHLFWYDDLSLFLWRHEGFVNLLLWRHEDPCTFNPQSRPLNPSWVQCFFYTTHFTRDSNRERR